MIQDDTRPQIKIRRLTKLQMIQTSVETTVKKCHLLNTINKADLWFPSLYKPDISSTRRTSHKAHNISWRTSSGSGRDSASASETHEDALLPRGAVDTASATSVWLQHVVQHSLHMLAQSPVNHMRKYWQQTRMATDWYVKFKRKHLFFIITSIVILYFAICNAQGWYFD